MSKLDEILQGKSFGFMGAKDFSPEVKQQIKELMLEIVDEELTGFEAGSATEAVIRTANSNLRRKIQEL